MRRSRAGGCQGLSACSQAVAGGRGSRPRPSVERSWLPSRGPGRRQGSQGKQINLRVDGCRVYRAMPQDLANLGERSTLAEHLGGQRMPKQVSTLTRRYNAGALERPANDAADRHGAGEATTRCPPPDEETTGGAVMGPSLTQVGSHGLAHVAWNWQPILSTALAPHRQPSRLPVDVGESHGDNLPRTKAESRQQKQHGVVPLPRDRLSAAGTDETFHLLGRQGLGQGRQSPLRHLGHGRGEIDGNVPTPSKKPEEGTKRAHHELRPARTNRLQLPEEKARHLRRTHVIHHDGARPKAMSEKAPNEGQA